MAFRKDLAGMIAVFMALAGCTTLPEMPASNALLVKEVIDRVQCEFQDARQNLPNKQIDLRNWHGEFELTLKVLNSANFGGNIEGAYAVTSGTLTPGFGLGVETQATRSITLKFDVDFTGKKFHNCGTVMSPERSARGGLSGNLGLLDGLKLTSGSIDRQDIATATGIGHYTEFVIVTKGDGSLGFSFAIPTGKGTFGLASTSTNTLNAAFAPIPPEAGPQPVVIVRGKKRKAKETGGLQNARNVVRTIMQNQVFQNLKLQTR